MERSEPAKFSASSKTSQQAGKQPPGTRRSASSAANVTAHATTKQKTKNCSFCQEEHYIASCEKFRAFPLDNRCSFVSDKQLCFNCLGPHPLRNCQSKKTCNTCQGRHHTLLHKSSGDVSSSASQSQPYEQAAASDQKVKSHTIYANLSQPRSMLLATARLSISSEQQRSLTARALVDPCSEASLITESLVQRLRLPRQSVFVPVLGVGAAQSHTAKTQANVLISPHFDAAKILKLKALILPRLTDYLSSPQLVNSSLSFIDGLRLADPRLDSSDPIEIIMAPTRFLESLRKACVKTPTSKSSRKPPG